MKKSAILLVIILVCVLSLLMFGLAVGCGGEQPATAPDVTFDHLFTNLDKYDGRQVTIEGYYYHGFETIVLSERLGYSGYAEGHLVPKGLMLWIEGGIPEEVYDGLHRQQMMGPIERFGKLRMTGLFEYGGKYGHLGQFNYQITPSQVELVPLVPSTR